MPILSKAIEIAIEAHKGQIDKSGMPYIGHVMWVMQAGKTEDEKIAGVLHDLIEDTPWTFEQLLQQGFPERIVDALRCLSKLTENEDYDAFIERIKANPLAVAVKINDLTDNMDVRRYTELTEWDIAWLKNT